MTHLHRRLPAVLIFLFATLGLALGATFAAGTQQAPAKPNFFAHERHVSPSWSSADAKQSKTKRDGEVPRDCRGCHDYRKDVPLAELAKPTDRCERCHDPDGYWKTNDQTVNRDKARVDPKHEATRLFKHASHLVSAEGKPIDCAECHYEDAGTKDMPAWRIKLPSDNAENKSYCTKCHNNAKPAEQWSAEERSSRKAFNAGLTAEAAKRAKSAGARAPLVFSHAAHLDPKELAGENPAKCQVCHTSLQNSKPESLAETQFDTNACEICHTGMEFTSSAKREDGTKLTVSSPTAGVFSHAQHLAGGAPKNSATKPIGDSGCLACHLFESIATRPEGVRTFMLKPFLQPGNGKGAFQGCVVCHTEIKIQNHGNTDECAQCHIVEAGSMTQNGAMKSNRPLDSVTRVDAASFTFEVQSHKFISKGQTEDAPQSCAECHKAKLELQPSRIKNRVFDHATHLPRDIATLSAAAKTAACEKCHADVANSGTLKDIQQIYAADACIECHGKTGAIPTLEKTPRDQLYRFDHKKHVGAQAVDGHTVSCADCHLTEGPDQAAKIVLAAKVAECTLCHGHSDKADARTNRFTKAAVVSCTQCHVAGVPAKGEVVPVGRARLLVKGNGSQEHTGEGQCTQCHILRDEAFDDNSRVKPNAKPIEVFWQTQHDFESPHEARLNLKKMPNASPEQKDLARYFSNDVACIDCHWASVAKVLDQEVVWKGAAKSSTLGRVKTLLSDSSWHRNYRQLEGKNLGGPGSDYPSGFPGVVPSKTQ